MPPQSGKSSALDKLKKAGAAKAFDAHKADETTLTQGGDLPPGINNGVARLVMAKLDEHKDGDQKGQPYVTLQGVVIEPKEHEGGRTSKFIGLYASGKKTLEEKVAEALNEMRKLGVDTSTLTLDDWEEALAALESEEVHFKFRTWAGTPSAQYPNPRTNHDWRGVTDYTPTVEDAVEDNTATKPAASAAAPKAAPKAKAKAAPAPEPEPEASGDENWDALGEAADAEDVAAQKKIEKAGQAAGIDTASFGTWSEAAAAVAEAQGGDSEGSDGSGEEEGAAEEWKPSVGDVYKHKPKGARKDIEIEVTHVFKSTLNAKEIDGEKTFKGLAWTANPDTIGGQPI